MKKSKFYTLIISIFFVFFTINTVTAVSACRIEPPKIYQISAQAQQEIVNEAECLVCSEEPVFANLCARHLAAAIFLFAVLIINFIRIKNPVIKMMINSLALLILIIVFTSLYGEKLFTKAKICLVIMAVYVILWVVSIIKTMGATEDKKPRSKQRKK